MQRNIIPSNYPSVTAAAEINQLEMLIAHCTLTIEQSKVRLRQLHMESKAGVSTPATRRERGASSTEVAHVIARREKHYAPRTTND